MYVQCFFCITGFTICLILTYHYFSLFKFIDKLDKNYVKAKLADTLSVLTNEGYTSVNQYFTDAMAILTKYKELKHKPAEPPLC